jgi:hypothetical protein
MANKRENHREQGKIKGQNLCMSPPSVVYVADVTINGLGPLRESAAGEHQAGNSEQSVNDPEILAAPLHDLAPPFTIFFALLLIC